MVLEGDPVVLEDDRVALECLMVLKGPVVLEEPVVLEGSDAVRRRQKSSSTAVCHRKFSRSSRRLQSAQRSVIETLHPRCIFIFNHKKIFQFYPYKKF